MQFTERQRFNQWWLWLILLGTNGLLFYGIFKQVFNHEPVGDNPMPDSGLFIVAVFFLLLTFLMYSFRLDTEIKPDGIHVQFFPFQFSKQHYTWAEIDKAWVRKYKPIAEFGGWGLRYGFPGSGKAYNVSGNMGLQLVFTDGKKLLIGTNKPEALQAALLALGKDKQ